MSTYYHFVCTKCNQSGGFFSRQAWGWGNFDIIDSFKFLAKHCNECGHDGIRVGWEQDDDEREDMTEPANRARFLDETKEHFPRSDDWRFMRQSEGESDDSCNQQWMEKEAKE